MKVFIFFFFEFFEINNDVFFGDFFLVVFGNEGGVDGFEFVVVKDFFWGMFDVDDVVGFDEGGGGCGGEGRFVFEGFGFIVEVKYCGSYCECGMSVSVSGGVF